MSVENSPSKERRSPRVPGEGRRPTITFRCRAPLKERIEAAAHGSDRSVSEEIERKLEYAYSQDENAGAIVANISTLVTDTLFEMMHSEVGGRDNYTAGLHFANALKFHQREADAKFRSEEPWFRDFDKKKRVVEGVQGLVPFIVDQLINRLDPEAEERARQAARDSPLAQLGLGLSPLGSLGAMFETGAENSQKPPTPKDDGAT